MKRTAPNEPGETALRPELDVLMADVETAYRRARRMVFDRLPDGCPPHSAHLNLMQRLALSHLERAEQELKAYRWRQAHDSSRDRSLRHSAG
jgi:hypothetical protein